jgi:5-methylcytosine-specific restriction endonuclease McrA
MTAVLERPTLVLNRNWQPVGVMSVSKALVKVSNESARIIDPETFQLYEWQDWADLEPAEGEAVIRAKDFSIRVPEVIVLRNYDKLPTNSVTFSRRNIFKRDRYTCQFCGRQPGTEELTIDHVTPRAQGGTSTWENCVLACLPCNSRKADRTPAQAKMPLRTEPKRPTWKPIYASRGARIDSWSKFISEAYWSVGLEA